MSTEPSIEHLLASSNYSKNSVRLAVIDIGTVTTRLMVADVCGWQVTPLVREARITQLGEGIVATNTLTPQAIGRTVGVIIEYLETIAAYERQTGVPANRTICIATSASRDANNASEFASRLAALGLQPQIIPGQREAQLSFLGAASAFGGEGILVVDIGGGSTEVVLGSLDASEPNELVECETSCEGDAQDSAVRIDAAHSFDIGCRRVTDIFLKSNPPSDDEVHAARSWITSEMRPFFEGLSQPVRRMIAVAGTATTLVAMEKQLSVYDSAVVHGSVITRTMLEQHTKLLAGLALRERERVVGLQRERAGVIVGGLLVLESVLDLTGLEEFVVSESDILQGAIIASQKCFPASPYNQ